MSRTVIRSSDEQPDKTVYATNSMGQPLAMGTGYDIPQGSRQRQEFMFPIMSEQWGTEIWADKLILTFSQAPAWWPVFHFVLMLCEAPVEKQTVCQSRVMLPATPLMSATGPVIGVYTVLE